MMLERRGRVLLFALAVLAVLACCSATMGEPGACRTLVVLSAAPGLTVAEDVTAAGAGPGLSAAVYASRPGPSGTAVPPAASSGAGRIAVALTAGYAAGRTVVATAVALAAGPAQKRSPARVVSSPTTALLRSARQDFEANRFAAASGKLEELLRRNPAPGERAQAYVLLCESRLRQGEFAPAESLAVTARTTGRISDEAALERLSFLRAEILYFSGDTKRAADEYISFLEENLESSFLNDAVERLLLIDENTGSSAEPLEAYARAELAELAGSPDSAVSVLDGVIRDPASPLIADDALMKKGDILRGLGKFSEAVEQYRLVEVRFPQSRLVPVCKLRIAVLYAGELGEEEKAVAECEEVATGFPGTSYAVEARALLSKLADKDRK